MMISLKQAGFNSFDGTEIYYECRGEGPPLVLLDGVGCCGYAWKYIKEHFSTTNRFIHMHYRGHGKSRVPEDENNLSIQDICRDLEILMDREGVEEGVLLGHSMGVQVILEFTRLYPGRVKGLIPMCGSYEYPLKTFHDNSIMEKVFPFVYVPAVLAPWIFSPIWKLLLPSRISWEIAIRTDVNGRLLLREDMMAYFHDLSAMPMRVFIKTIDHASRHSCWDMLGDIRVPTLIIGAEHDTFTPVRLSEKMHHAISGSEIMIVPHGTHTAPIEMPQLVNLRLEKWLRKHYGQTPPDELETLSA